MIENKRWYAHSKSYTLIHEMARVLAHAPNKEPLAGARGREAVAADHVCALSEKGC